MNVRYLAVRGRLERRGSPSFDTLFQRGVPMRNNPLWCQQLGLLREK
jgi:hypothetical protein